MARAWNEAIDRMLTKASNDRIPEPAVGMGA